MVGKISTSLKIKIILLFYLIYYVSYLAEGFFVHWLHQNYPWEKPGYLLGIMLETLMLIISSFLAISFANSKNGQDNSDDTIDSAELNTIGNFINSALRIVFAYCFLAILINSINTYFSHEIYSPKTEYKFYIQMIYYFRTAMIGGITLTFIYIIFNFKNKSFRS